ELDSRRSVVRPVTVVNSASARVVKASPEPSSEDSSITMSAEPDPIEKTWRYACQPNALAAPLSKLAVLPAEAWVTAPAVSWVDQSAPYAAAGTEVLKSREPSSPRVGA